MAQTKNPTHCLIPLHVYRTTWAPGDYSFITLSNADSSDHQWAYVGEFNLEVNVPADFDPVPEQIKALEKKKADVLAEAHAEAVDIDRKIQSLLAIDYTPKAESSITDEDAPF